MQGAKLREAVRRGALDEVHAILTAAGPANAAYLVQETEPATPKWDRQCSVRGSAPNLEEGYTAVHLAAKMNHVPILDALLKACPCAVNSEVQRGYSDHQVKKGLTPIMVAARNGHANAVTKLVSRDAALNDKLENGKTALLLAAAKGHSSALEALLQAATSMTVVDPIDINARDDNGAVVPKVWLIRLALPECHVVVVRVTLCSLSACETQSHAAALPMRAARVAMRIEGPKIHSQEFACSQSQLSSLSGHAPNRCLASLNDCYPAARPLPADPPTTSPPAPLLPLQRISMRPSMSRRCTLAVRRPPPGTLRMRRAGDTALHHAVRLESQAIRQAVLGVMLSTHRKRKPNVAAANNDGLTPLMLAIQAGHGDACEVLLRRRQNLNLADSEGCTALHCAGARGAPSRALLCSWSHGVGACAALLGPAGQAQLLAATQAPFPCALRRPHAPCPRRLHLVLHAAAACIQLPART